MRTLARPGDKGDILRRLGTLAPDRRARWGRMSAHQTVCHLSDGFRMAMGRMPVRMTSNALERTVVKWIALWLPVPWPHRVRTAPEIDQATSGTRPEEFAADVARLRALVEEFTAPSRDFTWQEHPRLGHFTDRDWMRWGWRHMHHHLRQFGA